jgi:hypothetical protein
MKNAKGIYDLTGYWAYEPSQGNIAGHSSAEYLFFSENDLLQWGYENPDKICVISFNYKIDPQFIKTVMLPNPREESTPYLVTPDGQLKIWFSHYETVWVKTGKKEFFTSSARWEPDPEWERPDYMKILASPLTEYHYQRAKVFNVSPQIAANTQALWLCWECSKRLFCSFHEDDFEYILRRGVLPGLKGNEGETLLMLVAGSGYTEAAKLLLDNGFEINTKNISGKTALDYATYHDRKETIQLLLSRGGTYGKE